MAAALLAVAATFSAHASLRPGVMPQQAPLPVSDRVQAVHDRAGRLRFWMDANGAAASPQRIAYRRYDAEGRVVEEGDVEGRFDPDLLRGLAEHPGEPSGAQRQWRRRYVYGSSPLRGVAGPLAEVQTRDAGGGLHVQCLRYDGMGRVVAVVESLGPDEPALHTRYHHDSRGRVVRVDGPSPVGEGGDIGLDYVYDEQDRLLSIGRHAGGVSQPAHYARYTWSADGRLLSEERNPRSQQGRLLLRYGYDGQGRLTSIDASVGGRQRYAQALRYDSGGLIGDMRQTWRDGRGAPQRLHWQRGRDRSASDAERVDPRGERLLQAGGEDGTQHAYAYDRNGNVLRKTGHLERIDIDPFLDRPLSLQTADGARQQMRYGGVLPERVWQSIESGPPQSRTSVQQAYYRGLSQYPLLIRRDERPMASETARRRSHQRMVWGPTGLVAVNDSDDSGSSAWGEDRFVVGNHQASTVMVLGDDGRTLASYAYDQRGAIAGADGAPLQHEPLVPYLFQGQEYDWATGLHNYRARLYDGTTLRFLAPDPVVVPGQPAYLAMNGDSVNFVDPDGRMVAGEWQNVLRNHRRRGIELAIGWAITFGFGPVYMLGLHTAAVLGASASISPMLMAAGGIYFAYLIYHTGRLWHNDRLARTQGVAIMGTIAGTYQATRENITLGERALLLFSHDLPSAFVQMAAAQGAPSFATPFTGPASDSAGWRVGGYMLAYATNSFAEVYAQGLAVHLQQLNGIRPDPNMPFDRQMALGSVNMLVGNFCFYACMAHHDVAGHWNTDMRLVQCKNIWMVCRAAGRLVGGALSSRQNATEHKISDGFFNVAFGYSIDRVIGAQILGNLPLRAVHGLFFPGNLAFEEMPPVAAGIGMSVADWQQLTRMHGAMVRDDAGQWP